MARPRSQGPSVAESELKLGSLLGQLPGMGEGVSVLHIVLSTGVKGQLCCLEVTVGGRQEHR